jgi:putative oxidoreductase
MKSTLGLRDAWNRIAQKLNGLISHNLLAVIARFSIASLFLLSGRTKVDGWLHVTDGAIELFRDEYRLPLLSPDLAAHISAYAEHLFPALLVLGLLTRLSAVALLGMTSVIEIFVYPDAWPTHLSWAGLLLYLVARGAGSISVDRVLEIK